MFEETNQTTENEGGFDGGNEGDFYDTDIENTEIGDCSNDLFDEMVLHENQAEPDNYSQKEAEMNFGEIDIVYNGKSSKLLEFSPEVISSNFQKGLNYDHIKNENNVLRMSPAIALMGELASLNGKTTSEYMEGVREEIAALEVEALTAKGISREEAARIVEAKNLERDEALKGSMAEYNKEQENMKMYADFNERFPNADPQDIPMEVWERHLKGESLVGAYLEVQNRQLASKLEILEQNQMSRQKAMGSALTDEPENKDSFLDALFG